MAATLTFPIQATSFATARFGIPIVMFLGSACAILIGYALHSIATPTGYLGIPAAFVIVFDFVIPALWLKYQRPTRVAIFQTELVLTSIPILGFGGGKITQRSLSEFKNIDAIYSLGPMVDRVDRIILRGNSGHADITLDVSIMTNTVKYAKELGEALNLPVNLCPTAVNVIRS